MLAKFAGKPEEKKPKGQHILKIFYETGPGLKPSKKFVPQKHGYSRMIVTVLVNMA
jgi:hypothetical protein